MAPKLLLAAGCQAVAAQIVRSAGDVLQPQPPGPIAAVKRVTVPQLRIEVPCVVQHAVHGGRLQQPAVAIPSAIEQQQHQLGEVAGRNAQPRVRRKDRRIRTDDVGLYGTMRCLASCLQVHGRRRTGAAGDGRQRAWAHPVKVVHLWVPAPLRIPDPAVRPVLCTTPPARARLRPTNQRPQTRHQCPGGQRCGAPCSGQSVRGRLPP